MIENHKSELLDDPRFQALLVSCLEKLERGEELDRHDLARRHPEFAGALEEFLGDRELLIDLAKELRAGDGAQPLEKTGGAIAETIAGQSSRADWAPGDRVTYIGEYEILDEIARGGMGVVYKARQQRLGRIVALKMILSGRLAGKADVERFHREARAAGNLKHPGIVPVHEVGEHEGHHYFTMDFVEGPSLADLLREKSLPPRRAAEIVKGVAEAVNYAHQQGTLHRDLKPANVLLEVEPARRTGSGAEQPADSRGPAGHDASPPGAIYFPKITDFGLAKMVGGDRESPRAELTESGQILGTPSYMSPEQAAGRQSHVGPATDVYSLGAVLYACLTGRAPHVADSPMETLLSVIRQDPVPPRTLSPRVPKDLETICLKCLQKEPHRRYGTARELADDLGRFLEGRPVAARPIGRAAKSWRWCRRNPAVAGLLATVALLLLVGTGVATCFAVAATQQAQLAEREQERAHAAAQEALDNLERAEAEERRADENAASARRAAEQERIEKERAQQHLYAAQINLGRAAWENSQIPSMERALDELLDGTVKEEQRGWEWRYLSQFREQAVRTFDVPRGLPTSVAFSGDGRFLYAGQYGDRDDFEHDTPAKWWDLSNNQQASFVGETSRLSALAVSPDGRLLATSGHVWNLETGEPVLDLGLLDAVDFSPDGKRLVTTSGIAVRVHEIESGESTRLEALMNQYRSVRFSPDGKLIAAAIDTGVQFWNAETYQKLDYLTTRGERRELAEIHEIAFSPDGLLLAAARDDGVVAICHVETRSVLYRIQGHLNSAFTVDFSPDGTQLASGGDEAIKLWDPATGKLLRTLAGHKVRVSCVRYSRDGRLLASAGYDRTVKLWDPYGGHHLVMPPPVMHFNVPRPIGAVAFHPDGERLAIGVIIDSSGVVLCDARTGWTIRRFSSDDRGRATSIAFSRDGRLMATADAESIHIWDVESGRELRKLEPQSNYVIARTIAFGGGGRMAVASEEKVIRIYDSNTGVELHKLTGHTETIHGVAFDPEGKRLVSIAYHTAPRGEPPYEGAIRIWDATTGEELASIAGPGGLRGATVSPDGRHFAVGGDDKMIHIYSLPGGELLRSIDVVSHVYSLAYSPDGRLASGSFDGTVRLWNPGAGVELYSLKNHTGAINSLTFSKGGRRLAAGSHDTGVSIWDAPFDTTAVAAEREAAGLVRFLFDQGLPAEEVVERIGELESITGQVRETALEIAGRTRMPE